MKMDEKEFLYVWNALMKKIRREYRHSSKHYIKVVNNGGGEKYAQEYIFSYEDFVLFSIRVNSKQVYVGGEHLKNIKELSVD